jgi:hypothetical protein
MATTMPARPRENDWTKPQAMAIPKEGYFQLQNGRYGPVYPRTPACHGFTIIAKIKPGREETIRAYGNTIEKAIADLPEALATLKLHYLRWVLFDIGKDTYYQGYNCGFLARLHFNKRKRALPRKICFITWR